MQRMEETVYAEDGGDLIVKGSRVDGSYVDEEGAHLYLGVVDHITDCDGDVDDEGRPYSINPHVMVRWEWEDNERVMSTKLDTIGTYQNNNASYGSDPEFDAEELKVVFPKYRARVWAKDRKTSLEIYVWKIDSKTHKARISISYSGEIVEVPTQRLTSFEPWKKEPVHAGDTA